MVLFPATLIATSNWEVSRGTNATNRQTDHYLTMMKKTALTLLAVLALATGASAQLLTAFNFNDGAASGATITPPIASTGGSQATTITSTFVAGTIVDFGGTTVNAAGTDVAGNAAAFQGGTGAVAGGTGGNNGAYFEFTLTTTNLANLALSFAAQRTATGFTTATFAYSTAGDTGPFTTFGTAGTTGTTIGTSFATTGVVTLPLPAGAENQTALTVRATLTGATAATGNVRFDNIQFNAVPEPSTYAYVIGAFGVMGLVLRRRRQVA